MDARKTGGWSTRAAAAYVAVVVALLVVPFAAMPFAPSDPDAELQELAAWPSLTEDGRVNVNFLSEAGDWFDDHFAFRQQLITANARVRADLFGTSPTDQVVVGTHGWLYYGGTMADYQRTRPLSDRAVANAAANLALLQRYVEAGGATFLLAVAPNKNSLYDENMPYYELAGSGPTNWDRLEAALRKRGVHTVDLFSTLREAGGVQYMKTDTHWNTEGARLAYDAVMDAADIEHDDYRNAAVTWDDGFIGDVEAMLYPLGRTPEPVEAYEAAQRFSYENGATSVEDADIATASTAERKSGSLVMYRDSFGNALLPFFATAFREARFSKLVPYDAAIVPASKADLVVVERAERHLDFFATTPPIMPAPLCEGVAADRSVETATTMDFARDGPYVAVRGVIDGAYASDDMRVCVGVAGDDGEETWYEAFRQSVKSDDKVDVATDDGYVARIDARVLQPETRVSVAVVNDGAACVLASKQWKEQ
ncbi:hypothetical protein GMI70_05215 [Eggerthellaceae bacterium zg-893]|nr:hypothetical protein [Eggerthellaceae bacterium zg-893]